MHKNEDKRAKGNSAAKNILLGTTIGLIVIAVIFAICAALISHQKIGEGMAAEIVLCASFIGALLGAAAAARRNGIRKLPVGMGVGGSIFAVKIIFTAFGGGSVFTSTTAVFLICVLGGGLCGGLLGKKRKKKRRP